MQPIPEQFTNIPRNHGGERRLRVRRSPSALTYVTLGESNGGIVANISETGMYVTAGEPLREDSFSRISFRLPQSDRLIETRAEVVWTSESKKEAGLRFVEMREESREQIRSWISPPRRSGNGSQKRVKDSGNGENHSIAAAQGGRPTAAPAATVNESPSAGEERRDESVPETLAAENKVQVRPQERAAASEYDVLQPSAFSGVGPKAWALTEAQRAEFERLFPSEYGGGLRDTVAQESAARPAAAMEPAPAAAPSFVPPIPEDARQQIPAAADEQMTTPAAKPAAADVAREPAHTAPMGWPMPAMPSPRTPVQSLWDAPPPMLQPIIGGAYGSSYYGAQAADSVDERRTRRLWSTAVLTILIVAACFALGFAVGPDVARNWPMMEDLRQIVRDKLDHVKAVVTKGGGEPTTSNAPELTPTTSTNEQASASVQPAPSAPTPSAPIAPDTTARPADGAARDENAPNASGVGASDTPGATAPTNTAPTANDEKSKVARGDTAPVPIAADHRPTSPEPASSTLGSRTPAKETPVEKPSTPPEIKTAPSVVANTPHEAAPPPATPMRTPESSTPANTSSAPNSSTPSKAPSGPPARVAEPAANPKARPPSYFPVVAPAAGNVPRLIELPEEKVIDTAAVVIHSHQIVFVPAEPGPESSHKLEKLQIGERTTKLAPAYPPQAAQKGMGGIVHLRAIIGKDGNVQDVRPINGPILLIPAAVEAIRQWQYRPSLLDQQAIEMQEDFTIEFRPLGVQAKQ